MKITIDLEEVKEHGTSAAIVLAVVNKSEKVLSNTDVSNIVGISFPTAQKSLAYLEAKGLIKACGKKYQKL